MNVLKFKGVLSLACKRLTEEARKRKFSSSADFENRVRQVIAEEIDRLGEGDVVDFDPHPQAFPDIAVGECGAEVKFTTADTWKSIANSVLESQRVDSVKWVFVVFGKMGGRPEVRWQEYETCVRHVRTSHVPRFEIELDGPEVTKQPLFEQMGIPYSDFRKLTMRKKMRYIRAYARKIHPDGRLWWLDDEDLSKQHTLPVQVRLYTKLDEAEKRRLRAEAVLLCPQVVSSGRSKNKYDDVALFLLTYHGVVCHQARDLFSAGSVAIPGNRERGGLYIQKALKLLEADMIRAMNEMDASLFREYWGKSVPVADRLQEWLKRADSFATGWIPSECLFVK